MTFHFLLLTIIKVKSHNSLQGFEACVKHFVILYSKKNINNEKTKSVLMDFVENVIQKDLSDMHTNKFGEPRYTIFHGTDWYGNLEYINFQTFHLEGVCSAIFILGLDGISPIKLIRNYLGFFDLYYRPKTSFILTYRTPQTWLTKIPLPFYESQAQYFFWIIDLHYNYTPFWIIHLNSSRLFSYCSFCKNNLKHASNFELESINLLQLYWEDVEKRNLLIYDTDIAANQNRHEHQGLYCLQSPWLLTKDIKDEYATYYMTHYCVTEIILVQVISDYFNFSASLRYASAYGRNKKSNPITRIHGYVRFNKKTGHPISGDYFTDMMKMGIFYCLDEYIRQNELARLAVWASPFESHVWFWIIATLSILALLLGLQQSYRIKLSILYSNLWELIRLLFRQYSSPKQYLIILIASGSSIFLQLSYENQITSQLLAPLKRPQYRNLSHLVRNGFKLQYLYYEEKSQKDGFIRNTTRDAMLNWAFQTYEFDLRQKGITKSTEYRNKIMFYSMSNSTLQSLNKDYAVKYKDRRFAIIDESLSNGYKSIFQTALPNRECLTVDYVQKLPIFDRYFVQGEIELGLVRKTMKETGIASFWDGLYKTRVELHKRKHRLQANLVITENSQDNDMISYRNYEGLAVLMGMLVVVEVMIFTIEITFRGVKSIGNFIYVDIMHLTYVFRVTYLEKCM